MSATVHRLPVRPSVCECGGCHGTSAVQLVNTRTDQTLWACRRCAEELPGIAPWWKELT